MIAKLQSISYTGNALQYCERGGEILHSNDCLGSAKQIYDQMKILEKRNDRCEKKAFHIKIRIAPEDQSKLTNQDWLDISKEYAKKIGFEKNLYAVYIHEEGSVKEHIHIVASRIREDNLAVPDNYTHYKNLDFCRAIEKKYNLRVVERKLEHIKDQKEFISSDDRTSKLKEAVFNAIEMSDSMQDLVFHLKNHNIKTKIGRGISFVDQNGVRKKGSEIDRKLSLQGIEKLLSYKNQEQHLNHRRSK
ncbi:relaxase/mobilization nuclease domain-containing protein [uncultured Christiangramia sp.]|uniref:relaxase/mobilization nuclease domain-containing protein n=1 Tax=uncultured Christiangramia sp. TaxID=503836 RepID=UPI00263307DC|nr:relaxase/mobilization nuclease domain-containing protein [uncultured Christiangramia sp.]